MDGESFGCAFVVLVCHWVFGLVCHMAVIRRAVDQGDGVVSANTRWALEVHFCYPPNETGLVCTYGHRTTEDVCPRTVRLSIDRAVRPDANNLGPVRPVDSGQSR